MVGSPSLVTQAILPPVSRGRPGASSRSPPETPPRGTSPESVGLSRVTIAPRGGPSLATDGGCGGLDTSCYTCSIPALESGPFSFVERRGLGTCRTGPPFLSTVCVVPVAVTTVVMSGRWRGTTGRTPEGSSSLSSGWRGWSDSGSGGRRGRLVIVITTVTTLFASRRRRAKLGSPGLLESGLTPFVDRKSTKTDTRTLENTPISNETGFHLTYRYFFRFYSGLMEFPVTHTSPPKYADE